MLKIQLLNKAHDRTLLDCGHNVINSYLKQQANQQAKKSYTQTHVLFNDDNPTVIIGFYTLTSCILDSELKQQISIKYPHELCGLNLARMGVELNFQGKGYSQYLIIDAIEKTYQVNLNMGVQGLFLDAKNDNLIDYYQHCGFELIPDTKRKMWIPISVIQKLIPNE
jgi:GNAT superfamily N-acetyltransferase